MADCPDGMCPVRHALQQLEKLGGGKDDDSALIRGGGVKPCCDIVLDEVRYLHANDVLDKAHGVALPHATVQQTVTRYMQPVCRVTARMLERAVEHIESTPRDTIAPMDLKPSMTISALQHNLSTIAHASNTTAPVLDAPALIAPEDSSKWLDYAGEYARGLEQQHIIACKWLSEIVKRDYIPANK
jgi:hypothetical protein